MIRIIHRHKKSRKSGIPITLVGETLKQEIGGCCDVHLAGTPLAWSSRAGHCMFTTSVQSALF